MAKARARRQGEEWRALRPEIAARWSSPVRPAPGELCIVQAFINSGSRHHRCDELESAEGLAAFLTRWRLLAAGTPLGAADCRRALAVRRGLAALAAANAGGAEPAAVEHLDQIAAELPLTVRFAGPGGVHLEPVGAGLEAALGRLLAIVQLAVADGRWQRLKPCASSGCGEVFYDHNLRGRWCTMSRCGTLAKARRYRQRQRARR